MNMDENNNSMNMDENNNSMNMDENNNIMNENNNSMNMDENNNSMNEDNMCMTYIEYKMHCYKQYKKPLNRNLTGPIVEASHGIEYGTKRPLKDINSIFEFLSNNDGQITRDSVIKALEILRIPLKDQLKIFELIKDESINLELFNRMFG